MDADVNEDGQQSEIAENFEENRWGEFGGWLDRKDLFSVDDHRGVRLTVGRDDATGAESVYHEAD